MFTYIGRRSLQSLGKGFSESFCHLLEHQLIEDDNAQSRSISTFNFPFDNLDLVDKCVYFVGKTNWKPSTNFVIFAKHFEKACVKFGEKLNHLNYEMGPVPAIHTKESEKIPRSVLQLPVVPRPAPVEKIRP